MNAYKVGEYIGEMFMTFLLIYLGWKFGSNMINKLKKRKSQNEKT